MTQASKDEQDWCQSAHADVTREIVASWPGGRGSAGPADTGRPILWPM